MAREFDMCEVCKLDEIWNETILNDGCIDYYDFRKWLKEESE